GRLPILEGGELLGLRDRNRRITQNQLLSQPAHRFQAERQGNHIKQQQAVASVADEHLCLYCGAERHRLVGIDIGERLAPEKPRDRPTYPGHPGRAPYQHHAVARTGRKVRVGQPPAYRYQSLLGQIRGYVLEFGAGSPGFDHPALGQCRPDRDLVFAAQLLLGRARRIEKNSGVNRTNVCVRKAGLCRKPIGDALVEIVATEHGMSVGGDNLKDSARKPEDRDVESPAPEVVDGIETFRAAIQAIGHGRRGRFTEQAQHVDTREPSGIASGLALAFVEVGGYGDNRAFKITAKFALRARPQHTQYSGGHLYRAFDSSAGLESDHPSAFGEAVGTLSRRRQIGAASTDESLYRDDRVGGVFAPFTPRIPSD